MSTEPVTGEEGVQNPTDRWEVGDTPGPRTRKDNDQVTMTSTAQQQGSQEGTVTAATPTCRSHLITSTSSSTPEKLAERGREQCGIECTAGCNDDSVQVCGHTSQRGLDPSSAQHDAGTDSRCGHPGRCPVFSGMSRYSQRESVPCSARTMSLPANICTVYTQRSSESSDMSHSDSSSASLTGEENFPETDVSAEKGGDDIERPGNGHTGEIPDVIEGAHLSDTTQDSDTVAEHGSDTTQDGDTVAERGSDTTQDSDTGAEHRSDTTQDSDTVAEHGSDTTQSPEHNADVADSQHPLTGPHRRHQTARQERQQGGTTNPLRRLTLPPAMLAQWRAVGRQWGVEGDDDIARVLMRHYEDVKAGRPPRPPPHQLCPDCGEVLQPVPCQECGPHKHSFRLQHDCGGGHSSGGRGSSFCP